MHSKNSVINYFVFSGILLSTLGLSSLAHATCKEPIRMAGGKTLEELAQNHVSSLLVKGKSAERQSNNMEAYRFYAAVLAPMNLDVATASERCANEQQYQLAMDKVHKIGLSQAKEQFTKGNLRLNYSYKDQGFGINYSSFHAMDWLIDSRNTELFDNILDKRAPRRPSDRATTRKQVNELAELITRLQDAERRLRMHPSAEFSGSEIPDKVGVGRLPQEVSFAEKIPSIVNKVLRQAKGTQRKFIDEERSVFQQVNKPDVNQSSLLAQKKATGMIDFLEQADQWETMISRFDQNHHTGLKQIAEQQGDQLAVRAGKQVKSFTNPYTFMAINLYRFAGARKKQAKLKQQQKNESLIEAQKQQKKMEKALQSMPSMNEVQKGLEENQKDADALADEVRFGLRLQPVDATLYLYSKKMECEKWPIEHE